jgi:crotonobetainyl-CoA:carnitine CoA-transferase CaiB-like acyl-CoA transferase|tara:strand:- start:22035 stop:23309 length:1275 start_codon:yes stop_codon:yes gene_type:complete
MSGPLSHIRVVEMAVAIQGPAAALYLRDMGADVIKIETPVGDVNRYHRGVNNELPAEALGSQFVSMNRGKKSVSLDVHTTLGLDVVQRLVREADVFLTNFREAALEKMGLNYAAVHKLNPKLIYGQVNGFGPLGPDAGKSMLDGAAIARGGLASITGSQEGGPMAPGATIADTAGAMQLALAIVTALVARARDGGGQKVHTSALGAQLWLQMWELTHVWMTGTLLKRSGAHHGNVRAPYGIYATADGGHFLFAVASSDESWDAFWTFAGEPAEAINPKWDTPAKRIGSLANEADALEIQARMRAAFRTKTTAEWQEFLDSQPDIVFERVRDYDEVRVDPQSIANNYIEPMQMDNIGTTSIVGNLVSYSETPASTRGAPPQLGADTESVLSDLGFTATEIESVIQHASSEREAVLAQLAEATEKP